MNFRVYSEPVIGYLLVIGETRTAMSGKGKWSAHRQGLLGHFILPLSKPPAFSAVKCVNVCGNVCICVCQLQQSKPTLNATHIQPDLSVGRQRIYESVRDLTRTIFQSILRHLFLWFYLISAYCLPWQMLLPFNHTQPSKCCSFPLSLSHTHSLTPEHWCLNLLKIINMISTESCLKSIKAEFPQEF